MATNRNKTMKKLILTYLLFQMISFSFAQFIKIEPTGITPLQGGGSGAIDRLTTPARNELTNQISGKLVFDTDKGHLYVWDGNAWNKIEDSRPDAASAIGISSSDNQDASAFGYSCAINGNWAVIGAPGLDNDEGEAYIFEKTIDGWVERKKLRTDLVNSSVATGDQFGFAVDIDIQGGYPVVAVGCPQHGTDRGRVFIFRYATVSGALNWKYENFLSHPSPADGDEFGAAVAIHDNKIIVGSPYDDVTISGNTFTDEGSVSIYFSTISAGTIPNATFTWAKYGASATDPTIIEPLASMANNNYFGYDVDISLNFYFSGFSIINQYVAIVGAFGAGTSNDGRAVMYQLSSGNTWSSIQTYDKTNLGMGTGAYIGSSVAIDGDNCVIGCPREDVGTSADAGAIVLLKNGTGAWGTSPTILKINSPYASVSSNGKFGGSVGVAGAYVIAGADDFDTSTSLNDGFVSVFDLNGVHKKVNIPSNGHYLGNGTAIAPNGDFIVGEANRFLTGYAGKAHFGNINL